MTNKEINDKINNAQNLMGTTVNERLYLTGLIGTFEKSLKTDKNKAREILKALKVDEKSINQILNK